MRSGPGHAYVKYSQLHKGWMVVDDPGQYEWGPYRYRWLAVLVKFLLVDES
jgi:hypothetical protein